VLLDQRGSVPRPIRRRIAEVLGNFPRARDRVLPVLVRVLAEGSSRERAAAAWSLAKLADPSTLPALHRAASGGGWGTRINATAAIARIAAPRSRSLLTALANNEDPYVRANAILGLGRLRDTASRRLFADRLHQDRNPWVRLNALRALLLLGAAPTEVPSGRGRVFEDLPALTRWFARTDPDPRVRSVAKATLRQGQPRGHRRAPKWIGLYLLDRDHKPLRHAQLLLITPDGSIKAGYSDARAQSWEERVPAGRCFVERPPPRLSVVPP